MSLTLSTLAPPSLAFTGNRPRRGTGILLNSTTSNYSYPTSSTYLAPSSPSSTTSSASQSASEDSAKGKSPSRQRITFAPLPKPRQNSNETDSDSNNAPIIVLDQGDDEDTTNQLEISVEDTSIDVTSYSPKKSISSWGYSTKRLLRPFYQPLKKAKDQLDVDAGGSALGLFRASSRDSTASSQGTLTDTNSGAPLKRRMSTGSSPFSLGASGHLVPNRPHSNSLALAPVTSENGGVAAGTRMLNGRIYGGSRVKQAQKPEQPTATAEPEFVEWGYGGMGSNAASTPNSQYAKVQSSHKNVVAAEDEDDGSGMGWVRKRREQREKEKKEREEREKLDKATSGSDQVETLQPPTTVQEAAQASSSSLDTLPDVTGPTAPVAHTAPAHSQEHVTQTLNVPVRPVSSQHHGHHHTHSKPTTTPISARNTPHPRHSYESGSTITSPLSTIPVDEEDGSESSEDEDSGEGSTEKDDDEEDEEASAEIACRKTSACAGVEKISRHKE
ncbi:hypothetical protein FRB96_008164 [Tulasnella sp. 330]|nr:hypothetical protein FRB96_008164 [Tulasnella sp. 330]KAG8888828.1 hypothetical protein FRB98_006724 [Tulasnella sp. 332]